MGGIVRDAEGAFLLVQRGHEPARGLWSIPGGRVEPGETSREAVIRELAEETGLVVEPVAVAGVVERAAPGGHVYVIEDWTCTLISGTPVAADDAADIGWFTAAELDAAERAGRVTPGLLAALREWQVIEAHDADPT